MTNPNDCVLCIEGAEYLVFVRGYTQSLYMESLQYPGNLDNMDEFWIRPGQLSDPDSSETKPDPDPTKILGSGTTAHW